MSQDYRSVELGLAAVLEQTEITVELGDTPFEQEISTVFPDPPASIEPGLLPCIILGDNPFEDDWAADYAIERYRQQAALLLREEDAEISVQLCKAYRQSIRDLLRANLKLGAAYFPGPSPVTLNGVSFGEIELIPYAGQLYMGFVIEIGVTLNDEDPGFAGG